MSEEGEKRQTKEIIVSVDSSEMKELIEQIHEQREELKIEREEKADLREKLALIGEIEFNRKKEALNAPDSIKTPRELMEWEKEQGIEGGEEGAGSNVGFGSAGRSLLQSQSGKKTFNSQEELIDYLQDQQARGSKTAKKQLDLLTQKVMKGIKEQKKSINDYVPKENEKIIEKYRAKSNADEQVKKREKNE